MDSHSMNFTLGEHAAQARTIFGGPYGPGLQAEVAYRRERMLREWRRESRVDGARSRGRLGRLFRRPEPVTEPAEGASTATSPQHPVIPRQSAPGRELTRR